ncbi:MAG TPA: ATP-binding protein [Steroidobacteraceae bacterium]|nr:ATP-binding protein [Steroidobacteraceae bacterium]
MRTTSAELARGVLDAAPDAMIIIDSAGLVLYANKQLSALFGYDHDEVVGQPVELLMPERFRSGHITHRTDYSNNKRLRPMGVGLHLLGRRRDGSEFPVEISLSPIEDAGRTLVAAAIRDVTDRKRVEAELILAREAAEGERESADAARAEADRANLAKSRFLATASHDLRQPIQTIALLTGTLRRIVSGHVALDAVQQQDQAIASMSRLLNALLDISKLESGAIKPEPSEFQIASLFEQLRLEFANIAASKGLRLDVERCADAAYSDPSLVEQILRNLVSNAIKYTREGSVRLRCRHESANLVCIEVLDTGIGIPADQIPYIFDEFYQVGDPTNRSREGYGLGLSIVQRLAKLLALRLEVHSEVGRGSTFSLSLPASKVQVKRMGAAGAESADTDRQGSGEASILLVEDNASVRRATCSLLELEGYRVTSVGSLQEALEHVHKGHRVDLLITDYHLNDGETGSQVIASLREVLGTPLRALITTGDTSSAIKKLASDPYLRITSKPINADELLSLLRALLAA